MVQTLNLPKKVYFKSGCTPVALRELGEIYHCSRALLVTDPQLYRAGVTAPIIDQLRRQGIRAAEFFTIGKRVSVSDLRSALPKLNEFQPDVIVGVGGDNAMSAAKALLARAVERYALSMRGYTRLIKVARTIADLRVEADLSAPAMAEAIQSLMLDAKYWSR